MNKRCAGGRAENLSPRHLYRVKFMWEREFFKLAGCWLECRRKQLDGHVWWIIGEMDQTAEMVKVIEEREAELWTRI